MAQEPLCGLWWCNFWDLCLLELTDASPWGCWGKFFVGRFNGGPTPKLPEELGGCWPPGAAHPCALKPAPWLQRRYWCHRAIAREAAWLKVLATREAVYTRKLKWEAAPIARAWVNKRCPAHEPHARGRQRALQEPVWKAYWNQEGKTSFSRNPSPVPATDKAISCWPLPHPPQKI